MKQDKKILIVEDDSVLLWTLVKKFKLEGFDVTKAKDGEEGLKAALKIKPDLILLDIIMPKMDGVTVLKKLQQDSYAKNIPVIMLTNLNDEIEVMKSVKSGKYDFLIKSNYDINKVVAKVRERLD